jgi:hypothetical protein
VESRRQYTEEALTGVANVLGVDKIDTLILSLPGIILEKDEEDYNSKEFPVGEKTQQSWVDTWKVFPSNILSDVRYLNQCTWMGKSRP